MAHTFRVAMQDQVDGVPFTFAVKYNAANANAAGQQAMKEWGNLPIVETRRCPGDCA